MNRASTITLAALVIWVGAEDLAAATPPADPAFLLGASSRVRCLDHEARKVVEAALAASPTILQMVSDLQSTDLIVGVETAVLGRRGLRGEVRVAAASSAVRHVRIRLGIPNSQTILIEVLGHELRHAMEIAAAPDVRDATTLRAHYLKIGYEPVGHGYYETDAAIETGRLVATEVAAARVKRQ